MEINFENHKQIWLNKGEFNLKIITKLKIIFDPNV